MRINGTQWVKLLLAFLGGGSVLHKEPGDNIFQKVAAPFTSMLKFKRTNNSPVFWFKTTGFELYSNIKQHMLTRSKWPRWHLWNHTWISSVIRNHLGINHTGGKKSVATRTGTKIMAKPWQRLQTVLKKLWQSMC